MLMYPSAGIKNLLKFDELKRQKEAELKTLKHKLYIFINENLKNIYFSFKTHIFLTLKHQKIMCLRLFMAKRFLFVAVV